MSTPVPHAHAERIREYYDHTWFDYRTAWMNRSNLAFHFGYHEPGIRGHHEALENANRVLARLAGIERGHHVLDAGCALGGSAMWLAEHVGTTGVGITLVPEQVRRARDAAKERGLADRVAFTEADYTHTGLPGGSFDVVWALESLCHAPVKGAFFQEAARLLRPGGRLVIAEYMRTSRPQAEDADVRAWLDGWAMPDVDTAEEHAANASQFGFGNVVVRDLTRMTHPSLRRLYLRSRAVWPMHSAMHRIGLRTRPQDGNVRASIAQYRALRRGAWFYGVLTATRSAA